MMETTLPAIYRGFALVIGMTSYRLVNGRFRTSWITQTYAVVLNFVTICCLPTIMWEVIKDTMTFPWLPKAMFITPFILYSVNYAVIVYIMISRCYRDSILGDLQDLTNQLVGRMDRAGMRTSSKLRRLIYLKSFNLTYVFASSMVLAYLSSYAIFNTVFVNIGYSMLNATTYFYFVSQWQIAQGYDYINQRFESGTNFDTEELRELWAIHLKLSRMADRINRVHGLQMLVSRLDFIIYSIVFGYVGILFYHHDFSPFKVIVTLIYVVRSVDFFLNDYISDLTIRYQCQPKHSTIEGEMSKEMSAYLIYMASARLNLKVCGLYPSNPNIWLRMGGFIVCQSVLLLQIYLILT